MNIVEKGHSWNFIPTVKQALIIGFFILLGSFISTLPNLMKPSAGRYQLIHESGQDTAFDANRACWIFDTATGKIYFWGANAAGLTHIDDPINNKMVNVYNQEKLDFFPGK